MSQQCDLQPAVKGNGHGGALYYLGLCLCCLALVGMFTAPCMAGSSKTLHYIVYMQYKYGWYRPVSTVGDYTNYGVALSVESTMQRYYGAYYYVWMVSEYE